MKLKPDDIMQEGDVIHCKNGESITVAGMAGMPVWKTYVSRGNPGIVASVTRPTGGRPTKKEEALRQTCVKQLARIEELKRIILQALPRIHQSEANDQFCRDVREFLELAK